MKVGFIGLGNVGGKLSGSLLRNGIELSVHDLNSDLVAGAVALGATDGQSPGHLMQTCDVVITCLPSPAASDAVMSQMIDHGKSGWRCRPRTRPKCAGWVNWLPTRAGKPLIALFRVGVIVPIQGTFRSFAGCEREAFETVLPLLTILGRRVLHTGDLGSASVLKVITNYLATANLVTCAEALTVAKAAGMDLATAYKAIAISSGTSFVHETESQVILNGSRDISFTMDLVAKDIGLFQAVADRAKVPLEINPMLINIFNDGIERFGPRELSPNIIKRLEEATGP
ncbi:2-(hydroxymethyl)glutarate dehydrogenase [Nymphon striatum]|nr:2-(hydroxymethyl)glutarate dehydrogenase [Nymphon striatum]